MQTKSPKLKLLIFHRKRCTSPDLVFKLDSRLNIHYHLPVTTKSWKKTQYEQYRTLQKPIKISNSWKAMWMWKVGDENLLTTDVSKQFLKVAK